jgi:hypothetical protein
MKLRARVLGAVVSAGVSIGGSAEAQVRRGIEDSHRSLALPAPWPGGQRSSFRSISGDSGIECMFVIGLPMAYCIYGKSWLRADRSESSESRVPRIVPAKDVLGKDVPSEGDDGK